MKVLWLCGLPEEVRLNGGITPLSTVKGAAWSWIIGHLPPPDGIELHMVCPVVGLADKYMSFKYMGVTWHCFKRKKFTHVLAYLSYHKAVRNLVNRLAPDIVHGWGGETGFGYFADKLNQCAVVSVQGILKYYCELSPVFMKKMGGIYGWYSMWRERRSYELAHVLLTESAVSADAIKRLYGIDSVIVPHPLRKEFLVQLERNRLNYAAPVFLFVGALEERKGVLDAVRAFSKLKVSARLIVIGNGKSAKAVHSLVTTLGVSSRVDFIGGASPSQIVKVMSESHFYLLPSYGDTGPTSLKEALACGLFPICYNNSGPNEYIRRYNCGYLAPTGSVDDLALMMNKAIKNKIYAIRAGMAAAEAIRADLDKMIVWGKLVDIYKGIHA